MYAFKKTSTVDPPPPGVVYYNSDDALLQCPCGCGGFARIVNPQGKRVVNAQSGTISVKFGTPCGKMWRIIDTKAVEA